MQTLAPTHPSEPFDTSSDETPIEAAPTTGRTSVAARIRADWPLFAAIVLSTVVMLGHAPYRDEWQALMIARDARSPGELLDNLRYEGHPWLWYAPLWAATRLTRDILAAQLLCVATAAAAQYVLWRHAPFPRAARALLICGYFVAYEYAVFARAYGLGMLLLVLAVWAFTKGRTMTAGAFLALACLTSAFAAVVAVAVAIGAFWIAPRDWFAPRRWARRRPIALAITGVGAAVAYAMTRPPADALHDGWQTTLDLHLARLTASGPWRGMVPVRLPMQRWNANLAPDHVAVILGVAMVVVGAVAFARTPRALRTWLVGSALLAALVYGKGFAFNRHVGHWFLLALVCAWLSCAEAPPSRVLRKAATVVLVGGIIAMAQSARIEQLRPLSASTATAEWIEANLPDDAVLVGETDWSASAVAGALDEPFWYPRTGEVGTFVRWYDGYRDLRQDEIEARALAYAQSTERPVYLVIAFRGLDPSPHLEPLASFQQSQVPEERYWVYRLVR